MLLRVTGKDVETFPIAGTRKITDDEEKNEKLKVELLNDEKELAEHTMLVDLGRNDIGKVCDYGTVHVKDLMQVKKFSHVQHIVTHVVGEMNEKYDRIFLCDLSPIFEIGVLKAALPHPAIKTHLRLFYCIPHGF